MFIFATLFYPLLPWICYSYGNWRSLWMASCSTAEDCLNLSLPIPFKLTDKSHQQNTVHLCLDLTPHIYLRDTPFFFFLHACAEVHQSHNVVINCSARCALQKYTRARKCNCRHSQRWDTGRWHRDQICSMHALEIRVSTSSFLIFNSNRNPSFFFKDAWDILSHGDEERR